MRTVLSIAVVSIFFSLVAHQDLIADTLIPETVKKHIESDEARYQRLEQAVTDLTIVENQTAAKEALKNLASFEASVQLWKRNIPSSISPEDFNLKLKEYRAELEQMLRFYLAIEGQPFKDSHRLFLNSEIFKLASQKLKWSTSPRSFSRVKEVFERQSRENSSTNAWPEFVDQLSKNFDADLQQAFGADQAPYFKSWLFSDAQLRETFSDDQLHEAFIEPWLDQIGEAISSGRNGKDLIAQFLLINEASLVERARLYHVQETLKISELEIRDWLKTSNLPLVFKKEVAQSAGIDLIIAHIKKYISAETREKNQEKNLRRERNFKLATDPGIKGPSVVSTPMVSAPVAPTAVTESPKSIEESARENRQSLTATADDVSLKIKQSLIQQAEEFFGDWENLEALDSAIKKLLPNTKITDLIWEGRLDSSYLEYLSHLRQAFAAHKIYSLERLLVLNRRKRSEAPQVPMDESKLKIEERMLSEDYNSRDNSWFMEYIEEEAVDSYSDSFEYISRYSDPQKNVSLTSKDVEILGELWSLIGRNHNIDREIARARRALARRQSEAGRQSAIRNSALNQEKQSPSSSGANRMLEHLTGTVKGHSSLVGLIRAFSSIGTEPTSLAQYIRARFYNQDEQKIEQAMNALNVPQSFEDFVNEYKSLVVTGGAQLLAPTSLKAVMDFYKNRGDLSATFMHQTDEINDRIVLLGKSGFDHLDNILFVLDSPFRPFDFDREKLSEDFQKNAVEFWAQFEKIIGTEVSILSQARLTSGELRSAASTKPQDFEFEDSFKSNFYNRLIQLATEAKNKSDQKLISALRQALIAHFSSRVTSEKLEDAQYSRLQRKNDYTNFILKLAASEDAEVLDFILEGKEFSARPERESRVSDFLENMKKLRKGESLVRKSLVVVELKPLPSYAEILAEKEKKDLAVEIEALSSESILTWIENASIKQFFQARRYHGNQLVDNLKGISSKELSGWLKEFKSEGPESLEIVAQLLVMDEIAKHLGKNRLIEIFNAHSNLADVMKSLYPAEALPAVVSEAELLANDSSSEPAEVLLPSAPLAEEILTPLVQEATIEPVQENILSNSQDVVTPLVQEEAIRSDQMIVTPPSFLAFEANMLEAFVRLHPDEAAAMIQNDQEGFSALFVNLDENEAMRILDANVDVALKILNLKPIVSALGARQILNMLGKISSGSQIRSKIAADSFLGQSLKVCQSFLSKYSQANDSLKP